MLELFATPRSGNCFKPYLLLNQLRIPFRLHRVDVLAGETKSADYLAINPVGAVPYLRVPGGEGLSESNAMLWFIAADTSLIPSDAFAQAKGLQWCFFEQSKLEPFISPARFFTVIAPERGIGREGDVAEWRRRAHGGLAILDAYLAQSDYIAGAAYSIADIGVFGYVHVAAECAIDLRSYPAVQAWIARVEATPGFVPMSEMTASLVGLQPERTTSIIQAA